MQITFKFLEKFQLFFFLLFNCSHCWNIIRVGRYRWMSTVFLICFRGLISVLATATLLLKNKVIIYSMVTPVSCRTVIKPQWVSSDALTSINILCWLYWNMNTLHSSRGSDNYLTYKLLYAKGSLLEFELCNLKLLVH